MNWGSPAEFFAMGGYALYVWGSFGACAIALIAEPILVNKRRTEILKSLRRERLAEELENESVGEG
ncbi:MAG: heme exporter protein CcmD [Rhodocyclaceae bacterium]|jgi:heme exporter protein D|nr:heme exporter protein CcmD [Rhodocyclaceae bacterium]